jgi:uncharacterized protein with FMN-binding domain
VKRIVLALASTVSVVTLLLGYHTSTSGPSASGSPPAVVSGGTATTGSAAGPSGSGSTSGSSGTGSGSTSGSPGTGSGSTSGSRGTGSSTGTTTVTGDTAQTQWGPVQVELTMDGSTISDVSVLQYPNGNGRDAEINSYALPILIQETIDRQSADIDMVSGATVTSVGYQQSLQSALDQANA